LQRNAGEGKENMNWQIFTRRTSLNLISAIILVVGLASAAFIYQRAVNDPYGEVTDETMHLIMLQNSKLYRHNLEVFGGKLNVIMDDFRRWLTELWHGKSLAFIIVCISIIISVGFFYTANYLPQQPRSDFHHENDSDENS
jgi:hypothetical protein